jgi:outer membrane protein TolC
LAQERYSQGVADFLSVLTAEQNLLNTDLQLTDSTTNVSTDLVQVYKALGGGWENDLPAGNEMKGLPTIKDTVKGAIL